MTAMRNGNKECPTCRKKLQSKRDLHPDATFDALIAKLFPNRAICSGFGPDPDVPSTSAASNSEPRISGDVSRTLLRKQEEKMAKQSANSSIKIALSATSASNNNSTQNGDTAGNSTNQSSKAASKKPVAPSASATNEEEEDDSDDDDDREVELLLKPLVKSAAGVSNSSASSAAINQETRCLKTTPKATIAHIAKYLALRRQVEADRCTETQVSDDDDADGAGCEYEIFAKARDARFVTLESTATLRRTAELYAAVPPSATAGSNANANANAQIKLVLFYKLRRESAANNSNGNTDSTSQPKRAKHDASSN